MPKPNNNLLYIFEIRRKRSINSSENLQGVPLKNYQLIFFLLSRFFLNFAIVYYNIQ